MSTDESQKPLRYDFTVEVVYVGSSSQSYRLTRKGFRGEAFSFSRAMIALLQEEEGALSTRKVDSVERVYCQMPMGCDLSVEQCEDLHDLPTTQKRCNYLWGIALKQLRAYAESKSK